MSEYEVIVKETCTLRLTIKSSSRDGALKEAERLVGCGIDAWESQGFKFLIHKLSQHKRRIKNEQTTR